MSDCEEELGQEEKEKGKRDSRGCWTLQENCKKKIRGDETKKTKQNSAEYINRTLHIHYIEAAI